MNIVWGTASTGGYGGTVFPGGVRYSLVNNVCGVRYSLGYRIHSDTGSKSISGRSDLTWEGAADSNSWRRVEREGQFKMTWYVFFSVCSYQ